MIYYDKQIDGIRVVVWHVTEEYEELLSMLPDADSVQNEAEQQFSSEFRRVEWTAVRVLLYTVLDRQVHINYNDQGAPLLPDYEGLHISISHTKGFVAIALSESDVVGIDEAQFFDMGLVDVCNQLANSGVRVIIAGLDMDFKGEPSATDNFSVAFKKICDSSFFFLASSGGDTLCRAMFQTA